MSLIGPTEHTHHNNRYMWDINIQTLQNLINVFVKTTEEERQKPLKEKTVCTIKEETCRYKTQAFCAENECV